MLVTFAGNWALLMLRAVLSIAFGLMALLMPGPTLAALIMLFGVFAAVNGALALIDLAILISMCSNRSARGWSVIEC